MKQIFFILLVTAAIQAAGQVGAPLTVTRPGIKSQTIKDGKTQTVRRFVHDHFDEVFIYYGKNTKADVYARVFKDSIGMVMASRIRDSLNRIHKHLREPGGMELHNANESIYFEWHPIFEMTTRDAAPSKFPAFIWTKPNMAKVRKLQTAQSKVDSTQRSIIRQLKRKQ